MSDAKYTPGPLELDLGQDDGVFTIRMSSAIGNNFSYYSNHQIEWQHGVDSSNNPSQVEETLATARLIVASPEVFEALKNIIGLFGKRGGDDDALLPPSEQEHEVAQALKAIAKAEGRS